MGFDEFPLIQTAAFSGLLLCLRVFVSLFQFNLAIIQHNIRYQ